MADEQHHEETASTQTTPGNELTEETENTSDIRLETEARKSGGIKNGIIALVVVLVLAGLAFFFFTRDTEPIGSAVGEENLGAVATVNGVDVTREDYERSLDSLSQGATLQGADISNPEVQEELQNQALTMVINNELLIQAAHDAGFNASEEEIETQFRVVEEQFGGSESLSARMQEVGITEADLREDIKKQLSVNAYVTSETNLDEIVVTDAEIDAFIASLEIPEEELPPLEEIRPQIEATLITEKQQEVIDAFIASLRESAAIDVHI